jgi:hypothetical protein
MAVFVYDKDLGIMVDRETRAPMVTGPYRPVVPAVVADIPAYQSPVTGEYIAGKRAKRADLDRHGCVDAAELPKKTDGKYRSKAFAAKRGLTHLLKEDAR